MHSHQNNCRSILNTLACKLLANFPLRQVKSEVLKADRKAIRKAIDIKSILSGKPKGCKYLIYKRQKIRANRITDKIQVSVGLKALSKAERKALFLGKQGKRII